MSPPSPTPDARHSAAWDFVTGQLADAEAERFTEALEADPAVVDALLDASDDLVHLRALGDAELRGLLAGADAPALAAADLLALESDPDARLEAALGAGAPGARAWDHFRAWMRRPSGWGLGLAVAAALALLIIKAPSEPVPDYSAAWRNGASATRAETGVKGRYLVGNVADLVLRPEGPAAPEHPEVRVFVGPRGGALVPVAAETEVGQTRAVRVMLEITPELGVGTHRVVVLVGADLDGVDPETDLEGWARVETSLTVVDAL